MMPYLINVKSYDAPPVDMREIMRYAGVLKATTEIEKIVDEIVCEVGKNLTYKICYGEFQIIRLEQGLDLGFLKTDSKSANERLNGCNTLVLFAATIGMEIDRYISRYSVISPTRALICQAFGAERIEALCDLFCADISKMYSQNGLTVKNRFSPGYGDIPLEMQKEIFAVLDCSKKIGVSLNDSLLMSPSKSVTAIIGIKKD